MMISNNLEESLYNNFLLNLQKSDDSNLHNNLKKIRDLKKIIPKHLNELKEELNILSNKFIDKKESVSLIKSYIIYINKLCLDNRPNINNKINSMIFSIINTDNRNRIDFYIKKIKYNIKLHIDNIDKIEIINNLNNLINIKYIKNNSSINNTNNEFAIIFLKLINYLKKKQNKPQSNKTINNNFEEIFSKINKNIYDYVYFLKNKNYLINEKNTSLNFINKIGFIKKEFKEIENLNLKRGFIQGLLKDDKNYILKFQPNKSFMELVINFYIKSLIPKENKYFLIPDYFFINEDNSYFYIIKKYDIDLYKYFNKLDENNRNISLDEIIKIIFFIMNSIKILHDNSIIHSDLKLENIILNYDENYKIIDIKIIDFDVSLFDKIPECLEKSSKQIEKILENKKPRGTRLYMLKDENMSFKSDIYSLGIIIIMLLYKKIKLHISINKKKLKEDEIKNKKEIIKQNNFIKKLTLLKDNLDKKENKIKLLDSIKFYFKKNRDVYTDNLNILIDLIMNCINREYNIKDLLNNYSEKLFQKI